MRLTATGLVLAMLAWLPSTAEAGVVVTFDASRTYSIYGYHLTGSAMVGPYNQLLARGFSVVEVSLITPSALANADVFVTGLLEVDETLAPSELAALQAFVAAGGGLMYIGENSSWASTNAQFASGFNGPAWGGDYPGGSIPCTPVTLNHPMITGPAGVVGTITSPIAASYWIAGPSQAQIMDYPNGADAVVGFSYGLGRVAFFGDNAFFGEPALYAASNAILWDNTIAWLNGSCAGTGSAYCTAGTTTHGCVPSIAGSGGASASAGSGFTITITDVEALQSGLIFYGCAGAAAFPWGTSTSFMCVKSPLERMPVQNSGGTFGACDGALAIDWNQYVATHPLALGNPFVGGETVWAQGWFRDPPSPKATSLSDGLLFQVCP